MFIWTALLTPRMVRRPSIVMVRGRRLRRAALALKGHRPVGVNVELIVGEHVPANLGALVVADLVVVAHSAAHLRLVDDEPLDEGVRLTRQSVPAPLRGARRSSWSNGWRGCA